ncbi:MAG: isoprenylcysteine carboxylmethyltransferase family protein [Chloroflexota bacterium]|nr:isoprenylcysteine carboxylmethyltransferase family protein [Chloroflexota bacterium]
MRALLGTLVFTILAPGAVTALLPWLLLNSGLALSHQIGTARFIGALPLALGAVFYVWTAGDFVVSGHGTPAPVDPPRILVSRGLYRLVRNPMYVGVCLALAGECILFGSPVLLGYSLLVWLLFHLFVVYYEEPHLRKQFGTPYEEYCRLVPRWVPRWKRTSRRSAYPSKTTKTCGPAAR